MRPASALSSPARRLALFGAALVLTVLSCTRDITAPDAGGRVARGLSFQTVFPAVVGSTPSAARDLVPFTTVHIVLRHSDGSIALDTIVDFPVGQESLTLNLTVTLLPNAPTTGEPLALTLDYVNAQGQTVFHGGPVTVLAAPGVQATTPVSVPVNYTGTGSNATKVVITPDTLRVFTGDAFGFSGAALDQSGQQIAGTPIVWSTPDASATVSTASDGTGTAGPSRGSARIIATLLTGPADTATLVIQPRPSTLAAVSGDGQTAAVRTPVANPIVVHVGATDGGGVQGVAVTFATGDSGSVDSTTVHTGADGNASVHWTLGRTVGPQTLTASVDGLTGSPVTFHATATAGAAASLQFTTSPDTVAAGGAFGVTVAASDSRGNTATAFTGTVTLALGANPGTDVLGGTLTADAVAGVATFSGLTLNKVASGYTIVATATGLAAGTSKPIVVRAGAVAACTLVSGGNQTAAAGSALGPIAVLATDAKSNPVAGAALAGAVSTGGTLVAAAPVTDATGQATFNWTLGATAGTQTLTVTCGSTTLVVTATATSVSAAKTWTGATSTVWSVAGNWSPSGVPASTDSVVVPLASNEPVLGANTTVKSLVVATGATLDIGANTLTVTGSLDAGTTIVGSGSVLLTGSGSFGGSVVPAVNVSGSYTISKVSYLTGNLTVSGSGSLVLNHQHVTVGGNFATAGSGTLVMTNANDTLSVTGNVDFSGGDETGKLSNGAIPMGGNFTQGGSTGSSFAASGSHIVAFIGGAQTVSFVDASGLSRFGVMLVKSIGGLSVGSDVMADSVYVDPSAGSVSSGVVTFRVNRGLADAGSHWNVTTTEFLGATPTLPSNVSGNVIFKGNPATLQSSTQVGGNLSVDTGVLDLNSLTLGTNGAFTTLNGGRIKMVNSADHLNVGGNATFTGGSETGLLTAGVLAINGSFSQGTNTTSFTASPTFVTRFNASAPTITFGTPATSFFGKLELADTTIVTMAGNVTVSGDVWLPTGLSMSVISNPSDSVFIAGNLLDSTSARWHVATTVMTGVNSRLPRAVSGSLVFAASNALADSLTVTGALTVKGAGTVLDVNGQLVAVLDSLATTAGGALKMAGAADTIYVEGSASFNGGSTAGLLTAGYLSIAGAHFVQGTNAQAFSASGTHETYFADYGTAGANAHTITFANPGAANSHFADLYVGDTLTILGSDVYAAGELETGITITHRVTTSTGDHLLTSNGANVRNLTFDNTRWLLVGTDNVSSMDYVTFQNISNTAAAQFEWNRAGTGTNYTSPYGWNFFTAPTTGLYIKMTSSAPADTLTMSVNTPGVNGGFVQALGGGVIAGWPNYLLYTGGNHGSWNTYGNWNNSGSLIPDSLTDVVIPYGDTVSLSANSFARSLTIDSGAVVDQGSYDLEVHGNLQTDTLSGGILCAGTDVTGITYQPDGPAATLVGRLCRYHSGRKITQVGPVTVSKVFHVHDSTYNFNGHAVTTQEAWVGTTPGSSGALIMTHAGDSLIVADSMQVGGNFGATPSAGVSTLTSGYIQVNGSFFGYGAPGAGYFNASAGNQTRLSGSGGSEVGFTDTTASGFGTLTVEASRTVPSVVRVAGSLYLIGSAGLSGSAGRLKVGGNLYGTANSSITTNAFELAGVNSDTGTFSPDTAVYTGAGQIIADSLAAGLGGYNYKSIRVAGTATFQPVGASGSVFMSGKLLVTGALRVGNGSPFSLYVGDSLVTRGSGVLKMLDANSMLQVAGNTLFAGGSTNGTLTAGTLQLNGNVVQTSINSLTSFAASSGLTTKLSGTGQAVAFASPGTGSGGSHFGTLQLAAAATPPVQLASDVFADGQLLWLSPTDTAAFKGSGNTLTVQGANVQGTAGWHITFDNVKLTLTDGATFTKLDGLTFTNFSSATPFQFARSTGTYALNYLGWEYPTTPYQPTSPLMNVSSPAGVTVNVATPIPGQVYWIANLAWYLLNSGGATVNITP